MVVMGDTMKVIANDSSQAVPTESQIDLITAFLALRDGAEALAFLTDLCSPEELRAMAERWRVVKLLEQGLPYRRISELTGVSTATVTRVARCLHQPRSGYALIFERVRAEKVGKGLRTKPARKPIRKSLRKGRRTNA